MKSIAPPRTLDELPGKLVEAWAALGCNPNDNHSAFLSPNFIQARQSVPVRQFPDWRQVLIDLIQAAPDAEVQHGGKQLLSSLVDFLDAAAIYQLTPLQSLLIAPSSILGVMPRDLEELEGLAEHVPELDRIEVQRHAVLTLARDLFNRIDASGRDQALSQLVPKLHPETLVFPSTANDGSYFGSDQEHEFCQHLESPVLFKQLLDRGGVGLRYEVFDRCSGVAVKLMVDDDESSPKVLAFWAEMKDYISKYAEDFAHVGTYWSDPSIISALLESDSPSAHELALARFISRFGEEEHPKDLVPQLATMIGRSDVQLGESATQQLRELGIDHLNELWQLEHCSLRTAIMAAIAGRLRADPDHEGWYVNSNDDEQTQQAHRTRLEQLIRSGMTSQASQLDQIKPADLSALVPYITGDTMAKATIPSMQAAAAKSKPLREQLSLLLGKVSPEVFADWATDKRKGVREVALEALLLNPMPAAADLLRTLHDNSKTSDGDKDRISSRLADLGVTDGLPTTSELELDELTEKAAKAKIKPQIKKLWTKQLAAAFAPLDEVVGQWFLSMTLESKDDQLSRTVAAGLVMLSREKQAQLAEHLINLWLAKNGDIKLRWLSKFLPAFGDDRVVEPLWKGYQKWFKRAKPKAVFVLETLGALDSNYALSQVLEVYGKNTYSHALQEGAKKTLLAAAERREVELLDLFDELTPDFGLGQDGLVLDVGPHNYVVSVTSDLGLLVRHEETGKTTKSFPKVKKAEDADLHAYAASQFGLLRSNLKKVAKQQTRRLHEAMISERSWSLARWRMLFYQHPLFGLLGQSIVWISASGKTFRISEDRSLISANDDAVTLADDDTIRIWHPCLTSPEQAKAWANHLTDYEVKPLLAQVDQPRIDLSEAELAADSLVRFVDTKVTHQVVRRSMDNWNYREYDGDGSWIASYVRTFALAGIHVVMSLDDMDSFSVYDDDSATIQNFEFRRKQQLLALREVPKPLLATIVGHGQALKAQAVSD